MGVWAFSFTRTVCPRVTSVGRVTTDGLGSLVVTVTGESAAALVTPSIGRAAALAAASRTGVIMARQLTGGGGRTLVEIQVQARHVAPQLLEAVVVARVRREHVHHAVEVVHEDPARFAGALDAPGE